MRAVLALALDLRGVETAGARIADDPVGDTVEPIEVRLASQAGRVRWDWGPVQAGDLNRVVALLKDGLNPLQVAKELGIAKSKSYLLRERAVAMGLLTPETEVRPQSAKASPA